MATRNSTSDVLTLASVISSTGTQGSNGWPDQFGHYQSFANWTVQVFGTATSIAATIQFSLDGANWFAAGSGTFPANPSAAPAASNFTVATGCSAPFIRANITAISGGNATVLAVGTS